MRITVFTPTYNRAYILENLYRSLQRQTFRDFEWILIDDGSSDNTEALVGSWMEEGNDFPIRYHKVPNGGKCRAINMGLDLAEGELFFTVDSDDYLTDDALEKVHQWEKTLPPEEKYCGFAGNLGTAPDVTPNHRFAGESFDGTALDRYGTVDGERAMVFYTAIHRQYRYPAFANENFITEAVTWNRMARDGYKMRFFNDIIWVFAYKEDGLTKAGNRIFLKNPHGYGLFLKEKAEFLGWSRRKILRMWYSFTCDLSGLYSSRQIAGFIGAPRFLIAAINTVHKLYSCLRQR